MCATCELAVREAETQESQRRFELLHLGGRLPLNAVIHGRWFVAPNNSKHEPLQLLIAGITQGEK